MGDEYDYVVWDLTRPDSTGPHFGPMTAKEAERWRERENFWVQHLLAPNEAQDSG